MVSDLELPQERTAALQAAGKTVVALVEDRAALALLAIADPLRESSRAAVARLKSRMGLRVVMLTGDNAATAAAIASEAGIDDFRAGILPGDKAAAVERRARRVKSWPWLAMASTMRQRWRQLTSASPSVPVPTQRSKPRT